MTSIIGWFRNQWGRTLSWLRKLPPPQNIAAWIKPLWKWYSPRKEAINSVATATLPMLATVALVVGIVVVYLHIRASELFLENCGLIVNAAEATNHRDFIEKTISTRAHVDHQNTRLGKAGAWTVRWTFASLGWGISYIALVVIILSICIYCARVILSRGIIACAERRCYPFICSLGLTITVFATSLYANLDLVTDFGPLAARQLLEYIKIASNLNVDGLTVTTNIGGVGAFVMILLGVQSCLHPRGMRGHSDLFKRTDLLKRIRTLRTLLYCCATLLVGSVLEIGALYNVGASLVLDSKIVSSNITTLATNLGVLFGCLLSLATVCVFAPAFWVLNDEVGEDPAMAGGANSPHEEINLLKQLKIADVVAVISPLIAGGPITALLSMFAKHGS